MVTTMNLDPHKIQQMRGKIQLTHEVELFLPYFVDIVSIRQQLDVTFLTEWFGIEFLGIQPVDHGFL